LPAIGNNLSTDAEALQWVINAYLLPLSALILLGGAAGDGFGRRRLLIFGTALFALASLGCTLAPSLPVLLIARLAQGVGAAMLMPNSLAILGTTFEGAAKGRAIGIWAATGAGMAALGPVFGGWLIDVASWRAIFLINLPIAGAAIVLAVVSLPADSGDDNGALDWLGGVLVTLGLGGLTYGLTIGSGPSGWSHSATLASAGSLVALTAFAVVEWRRGERAMVPLALFGSASFVGLSLLTLLLYGALGALFVLVPYVLIESAGFSASGAGAGLLPLPIVLALASPIMGGLVSRIGSRLPLTLGPLIVGIGFLLLLRVGDRLDYWSDLLPALLTIAIGMSGAVAPLTNAVLSAVDRAHTGVASGFNSAIARTGGLIATALLGSVLSAGGASLIGGFHAAMVMSACACAGAALSTFLFVRNSERGGGPRIAL